MIRNNNHSHTNMISGNGMAEVILAVLLLGVVALLLVIVVVVQGEIEDN